MNRGGWIVLAAVLVLAAGALTFWFFVVAPMQDHREWQRRARADLESLFTKRPAEVPPGEWEYLVGWTCNLHGNCGTHYSWVARDEMWPFLNELERRLKGPLSVATIDWIWDEYARITKGGRSYGDKYRPTQDPDLEFAQPGCFGMHVK